MKFERIIGIEKKDADARKAVITYNESLRKIKPTKAQVNNVWSLLRDFGVKKKDIPEFDTYAELDRWRHDFIMRME